MTEVRHSPPNDANGSPSSPAVEEASSGDRGLFDILKAIHQRVLVLRTLHALPYCALGVMLATSEWSMGQLVLLGLCAVFARATAVGLARAMETPADVVNPVPELEDMPPSAPPTPALWWGFALHGAAVFVFLAFLLNPACGWGACGCCALLVLQALARPMTSLSHLALGAVMGSAPLAGWVAIEGSIIAIPLAVLLLGVGATLWAAGFDILYSLREEARVGKDPGHYKAKMSVEISAAARIGRLLQIGSCGISLAAFVLSGLGPMAWAGPVLCLGLLLVAHKDLRFNPWAIINQRFLYLQFAVGPILFLGAILARLAA